MCLLLHLLELWGELGVELAECVEEHRTRVEGLSHARRLHHGPLVRWLRVFELGLVVRLSAIEEVERERLGGGLLFFARG